MEKYTLKYNNFNILSYNIEYKSIYDIRTETLFQYTSNRI